MTGLACAHLMVWPIRDNSAHFMLCRGISNRPIRPRRLSHCLRAQTCAPFADSVERRCAKYSNGSTTATWVYDVAVALATGAPMADTEVVTARCWRALHAPCWHRWIGFSMRNEALAALLLVYLGIAFAVVVGLVLFT